MISPDQTETMTLTVKAISGPLMFLMLVVNVFAVAALWQILKAANRAAVALWQIVEGISRIEQTYDEQVNGPEGRRYRSAHRHRSVSFQHWSLGD
jgi:hypothetical protein